MPRDRDGMSSATKRMGAAMLRRLVQEIRHRRELLTSEEQFLQLQSESEHRSEAFRRIRFWREIYADAEQRLGRDT
jgi:hypothetical protein